MVSSCTIRLAHPIRSLSYHEPQIDDHADFVVSLASVGPPATKRARGEKASEHAPSASTSARKKRRRAACLSELMNMPLDVVLEVRR